MSNAAIHKATPREIGRIVGAQSELSVITAHPCMSAATATHAPAGARPRQRPSQKWHAQVNLFMYGYATNATTGSHAIIKATSLSNPALTRSIIRKTADRIQAVCIFIVPDARCLPSVRGFAASMSRSMIRLSVIANPRAPTAAMRIHNKSMPTSASICSIARI